METPRKEMGLNERTQAVLSGSARHLHPSGRGQWHRRALAHLEPEGFELVALDDVPQILEAVQQGEGWGVVAWENNVEGYVVPNLDALIDAKDLAGFARVGVDVTFDAYVRAGSNPEEATVATAHSHGLAQWQTFYRGTSFAAGSSTIQCRRMSRH